MKAKQVSSILLGYWETSKAIACDLDANPVAVFLRMLSCRFRYDLDDSHYAYYNLHTKPFRECSQYLSKDGLDKLQAIVNPVHTDLLDDKIKFFQRCVEYDLPTPKILALIDTNGFLPGGETGIPELCDPADIEEFLLNNEKKTLMFKRTTGSYGLGMLSVTAETGRGVDHQGETLSATTIWEHCKRWPEIFMVQDHLVPHEDLRPIMPGCALGTFRVVTYQTKNSDRVSIPYAFAKIPLLGAINDNFHQGTTGNLLCGIDIERGKLKDSWGKKSGQTVISRIMEHPNTGVAFSGTAIPFWSEVLDIAVRAARSFKELRTVGWDVAVTTNGVFVLEGNWHYDPDGHQLTLGRGIRSEIVKLFSI